MFEKCSVWSEPRGSDRSCQRSGQHVVLSLDVPRLNGYSRGQRDRINNVCDCSTQRCPHIMDLAGCLRRASANTRTCEVQFYMPHMCLSKQITSVPHGKTQEHCQKQVSGSQHVKPCCVWFSFKRASWSAYCGFMWMARYVSHERLKEQRAST